MESEPKEGKEVLGNCSERWLFSARLYLLQVQPASGLGQFKGPGAKQTGRKAFAGVFVGHPDLLGMAACSLSPLLLSKGFGFVSALLRELAWLGCGIREPAFALSIATITLHCSPWRWRTPNMAATWKVLPRHNPKHLLSFHEVNSLPLLEAMMCSSRHDVWCYQRPGANRQSDYGLKSLELIPLKRDSCDDFQMFASCLPAGWGGCGKLGDGN
ncbi:PREDICTED: uncharacterized protein LOC106150072 [Chinchilla lanigera]|uniref:uncharacterized protein LOC106150072 n=1 Tax=Chinchilla lanigera TaxID=34839 RepID=UPI000696B5AE|nr:PREDICTED: uncharacterized protein LOC106150072 [Chinchilla lanigera]